MSPDSFVVDSSTFEVADKYPNATPNGINKVALSSGNSLNHSLRMQLL